MSRYSYKNIFRAILAITLCILFILVVPDSSASTAVSYNTQIVSSTPIAAAAYNVFTIGQPVDENTTKESDEIVESETLQITPDVVSVSDVVTVQFNFQDTTYTEVINFFSRATGLPVIREVEPPEGKLTYFASEPYTLSDGLRILNIILQTKKVTLRRQGEFLFLGKLDKATFGPTYVKGEIPGDVTNDELITVLMPLDNITAKELTERLKTLVGEYGGMIPLPQQNAILLTETAGQCRRLQTIVDALDVGGDYTDSVKIYPITHSKAEDLLSTLKVLMSERVVKYVINQQGQQVKLEEDDLGGMRIEADPRTNTIIAKGPLSRHETLQGMIDMLDVQGRGATGSTEMTTISLRETEAEKVAKLIGQLFQTRPEEERPTILPLHSVNKITIVGSAIAIAQSVALVEEVDGSSGTTDEIDDSRTTLVLTLKHATPSAIQTALQTLMTPRQLRLIRMLASPDGSSLILAGPNSDVSRVQGLAQTLDLPPATRSREIRIIRIEHANAEQLLAKTQDLYTRQLADPDDPAAQIDVEHDTESNTVTLLGERASLETWQHLLQTIEDNLPVSLETRQIQIANAVPSEIAKPLSALATRLLKQQDDVHFQQPQIIPLDELDSLLIIASPGHWAAIQALIDALDEAKPRNLQFRIVRVHNHNPSELAADATARYQLQTKDLDPDTYGPVTVEIDHTTGSLLLTASTQALSTYTNILNQLDQLTAPDRTTRFITLLNTRISDTLPRLTELLDQADSIDPAREIAPPQFTEIELSNGFLVTAESAQHRMVDDLLTRIDILEQSDLPPLRLLQLRAADVTMIANLLRTQYQKRPADDRSEKPVDVQADASTNTLIISAHESIFEDIKSFVEDLNQESAETADRVTEIYPLKLAKADELAQSLNLLYPEPPVPLDRRGRPMPWLREPREVQISFDRVSNSIIVDAPAGRMPAFKALVEKLDHVELPPQAQLKTYSIRGVDIQTIAGTLQRLASTGTLSGPSESGKPGMVVSITAEPVSQTLIVTGDEVTFARVEQLLEQLKAVPEERELRVVQINNADPAETANRALEIYRQQTEDILESQPVDIQIDDSSGAIFVVAGHDAMIRFLGIMDQLQSNVGPGQEIQLIAIEHADATEVVEFLDDLVTTSLTFRSSSPGAAPVFEVIERTNSILIAAQPLEHQIISSLIRELDTLEDQDLPPVRILQLETADAANLAPVLTQVYASRTIEQRKLKPVSIRADANTNTLLISAHPEPFNEIRVIVEDLNNARAKATTGREIRIFPLKVARAEELAQTLDQMFPEPAVPLDRRGRPMYQLKQPREVVVRADPQTNSIIVDAPIERIAGFEELVRQLDATEVLSDSEVRTYPIEYANLKAVENALQQLAQSGALLPHGQAVQKNTRITITSEPVSNVLIVSGPVGIFGSVERVLKDLDAQPIQPATILRFFRLEHARADRLVPLMQQLLIARLADETLSQNTNPESLLEVTSEPKTNTLIISAPESMMPVVEELIQQLDSSSASITDPVIRILPLTFADAAIVAQTINATLPSMMSPSTHEPMDIRVIAAPGSNALILIGGEKDLLEVEALIQPLDDRPGQDVIIAETFPLQYADAVTTADLVRKMLVDQQAMDPRLLIALMRYNRNASKQNQPIIRVEADERTNTLLVSAPQHTLALAQKLIENIDTPDSNANRTLSIYTAKRADPDRLSATVDKMLAARGGRQRVEIIYEMQSGVIVLVGNQSELDEAHKLLKRFDQETPAMPVLDLQLIAINNTDPAIIADALTRMLRDRARWPKALRDAVRAGIPVAEPTVIADLETNRVLISAPEPLMAFARKVIDRFDRDSASGISREVRVFNLKQANADSVAETLRAMFDLPKPEPEISPSTNRGKRRNTQISTSRSARSKLAYLPSISAETSTNSIIVSASAAQMAEIVTILDSIDEGASADQMMVRTIYLKHAQADRIAPVVERMLKGDRLDTWLMVDLLRRGREMPDLGPDVRVAAEPRLNAIIVSAPSAVLDIAEEMVHQLDVDVSTIAGAVTQSVQVIPLHNTDASDIANNLRVVFADSIDNTDEPGPVVSVVESSNSLIIRATDTQFALIDTLISDLESASLGGIKQLQVIQLDRSRVNAHETAETLQRLLQQRGNTTVEVISVDELIRRRALDNSEASNNGSSTIDPYQTIPARLRILIESITLAPLAHFTAATSPSESSEKEEPKQSPLPDMQANKNTMPSEPAEQSDSNDSLESDSRIDDAINHISPDTRILDTVDKEKGLRTLALVFGAVKEDSSGELTGDNNSVITAEASAQKGNPFQFLIPTTDNIIEHELNIEGRLQEQYEDVPVEDPDLAASIEAMLLDIAAIDDGTQTQDAQPRDRFASAPNTPDIIIAYDDTTNSLVIVGSSAAARRVTELALQIQDEIPALPAQIRYVKLNEGTNAQQIANLINSTLQQVRRSKQNTFSGQVAVIGDTAGGGLIVSANDLDFKIVGSLIAAMSEPDWASEMNVKIYSLSTIGADRIKSSITDIFSNTGLSTTGRRSRGRQTQRLRESLLHFDGFQAVIDPNKINLTANPTNDAIIISAPDTTFPILDSLIAFLDQSPTDSIVQIRQYNIEHGSASDIVTTLTRVFEAQYRAHREHLKSSGGLYSTQAARASFSPDDRTNSMIVVATSAQLIEISRLLDSLDAPHADTTYPLQIIELASTLPSRLKDIIERVVIGDDPGRADQVVIVPDDGSMLLLVRADDATLQSIQEIVLEVDRFETKELPIRSVKLERADADRVAKALSQFFEDRALISQRPGQPKPRRRVSVIGDKRSATILVAANDSDFAEVERLTTMFDEPSAAEDLQFNIIPLLHAKAEDVSAIVENLSWELTYDSSAGRWGGRTSERGKLSIQSDKRTNSIIVSGTGENFALVENVIRSLDVPAEHIATRSVRILDIANGDTDLIARAVREAYGSIDSPWWWYEESSSEGLKVLADTQNKLLVISGDKDDITEAVEFALELDEASKRPEQQIEIITLQHAQANEVAGNLIRFFRDRARTAKLPDPGITISPAANANKIVVSAPSEHLLVIKDLLQHIDVPSDGEDRNVNLFVLEHANAIETAGVLRQVFPSRGLATSERVLVTSDARTNALIVSAPDERLAEIRGLLDMVDAPAAGQTKMIRTFALSNARASEVAEILTETLTLNAIPQSNLAKGLRRTVDRFLLNQNADEAFDPMLESGIEIDAQVTPSHRTNALIVVATPESMPLLSELISELDEAPAVSEREFKIYALNYAIASEVRLTLSTLMSKRNRSGEGRSTEPAPSISYSVRENTLIVAATADQHLEIESIVAEIDQPSRTVRTTEFISIEFAEAEKVADALDVFYGRYALEADNPAKRNVSIVPDPASNSLVISADKSEWVGIRELIAKLDAEEYDSSLQLEVIALRYADAGSVADSINQAFAPSIKGRQTNGGRGERNVNEGGADAQRQEPRILVDDTDIVRAAAERMTNSIIVSASRRNMAKINSIIANLDSAEFAQLPPARLLLLDNANAADLVVTLRTMYANNVNRGNNTAAGNRQAVMITADTRSNAIVVRAEDQEFEQIHALSKALESASGNEGVAVRVLQLEEANAVRIAESLRSSFEMTANESNEPLSIQADRTSNSLIVAASARMYAQIEAIAYQLDAIGASGGRQIFIVPVENITPNEMKEILESLEFNDTSIGIAFLTEPIRLILLPGQNVLAVLANPIDRDQIFEVIASIDVVPDFADREVRLVQLRKAEPEAIAAIMRGMFNPGESQSLTKLSNAVQEQIHRLRLRQPKVAGGDIKLDLTLPIHITAAPTINGLLISSTPDNCQALEELVLLFDRLPVTDAVTIQIFPLSNISAQMMMNIAADLFAQGEALSQQPGTKIKGEPTSEVGIALLDNVAMTIDERTNTLIVAGRDESLALVTVLVNKLDHNLSAKWVEPRVIPVRFADAETLAETLYDVLVKGRSNTANTGAIQRQVARLRILRSRPDHLPNDIDPGTMYADADIFVPMTQLLIRAESQLNALLVVGTPDNINIINELVEMLDIPAASPSATVRIYTLKHASAGRVAAIVRNLFDQQIQTKAIRAEDKVIVQPDERTNALVVTTSTRSFAVLESLLESLDAERSPDLREIRIIYLTNASATLVAPRIQQLMDARLERMRSVAPEAAELEMASIISDPRTNSLLIASGNESYEVIERMAEALDSGAISDSNSVRVIAIEVGNAVDIARTLQDIMDRQYSDLPDQLAAREKPLILTDTRTNSLLVTANSDDLKRIEELVQKLENAPLNPAVSIHVLALAGHNADSLAPRLQRIMDERERSLGSAAGAQDKTVIQPDMTTNSLIVASSDENLEILNDLIETLDRSEQEIAAGERVEIITLENTRADRMLNLINELYVEEANRVRGNGTVRATADTRLNAIIISATELDITAIRTLVDDLETAQVTDVREIRIIPLKAANAAETVSLIEAVLASGRRRNDQQATVIRFSTNDDKSPVETQISTAVREAIRLTPDLRTNSIIVSAPASSMDMIRSIIDEIDSAESGSKRVKIFELTNADAIQMAEILSDLFNLRQSGNLYVLRPKANLDVSSQENGNTAATEQPVGGQLVSSFADTDLITVPDERQQLSITVDARTNSLLVSGTPSYLELVEDVIIDLDSKVGARREEFVYELRNARADQVALALTEFLTQEQERILNTLGPDRAGSIIQQLEREISVVGVEESNTLLVSTSPRYIDKIKMLISELDNAPPQVLISVMLAEVTLDSDNQWGMEFNVGPLELGENRYGASSSFGLTGAAVSGLGVPNLSVTADDFGLLIRALEAQGKLEVLSRPQILVNNNQQAHFQVGQEISIVGSIQVSDSGATSSTVDRKDIGIILDVLPSISPDRFVRMDIRPEISSLSAKTTQISEDFSAPIIDKREVSTVVTVKDGQTVVIGGLFSNRSELRNQKVPFFGDLPIIGAIFRTKLYKREKTELLVVITPHVVNSPEDARRFTDDEIINMTLPQTTKEQLREGRVDSSTPGFTQLNEMFADDKKKKVHKEHNVTYE